VTPFEDGIDWDGRMRAEAGAADPGRSNEYRSHEWLSVEDFSVDETCPCGDPGDCGACAPARPGVASEGLPRVAM
jgi:hypothetical protein